MILDATGWAAVFKFTDATGDGHHLTRPLVLWQENELGDVYGLIVSDRVSGLERAANYPNFVGYERDDGHIVAIVPATGLRAIFKDEDGIESRYSVPLYALMADGEIKAVEPDADGGFDAVTVASNFVRLELDGDQ